MRKLLAVVALSLLLMPLFPLLAQAARPTSGGVVGTGTPASCDEEALSTALAGGGPITFNCGSNPHTITMTFVETIELNTTIDGGGKITLSGGNETRLFNVNAGATLTLRALTLRDGNEPQASGIDNDGLLVLEGITFLSHEEGIMAIDNEGSLTVRGSTFSGNRNGTTGVIYNGQSGTLLVENSIFSQNSSESPSHGGGAIYNHDGGTVTIRESQFTANSTLAEGDGAALFNRGQMSLSQVRLTGNSSSGDGGAVYNHGQLTISESVLANNGATNGGGAIQHENRTEPSSLVVERSAIHQNQAQGGAGGGINMVSQNGGATLTVRESTLSTNTAQRGGGLAVEQGSATLINVTVASNSTVASGAGANLANGTGSLTLRNTLVAGGCHGAITDGGNNLQAPGGSCGASIPATDLRLGSLQDNGGWTLTHAIAAESPARNAGNNAHCAATDQRGILRPQQATCDIGAFEWGARPLLAQINPTEATALDPALTLTVRGSNFIPGMKGTRVLWNGSPLVTTYVSPVELRATVPAAQLVAGGAIPVTLQTPTIDGAESDPMTFVVHKRTQQINFAPLANRGLGDSPVTLTASASSTLPVTFSAQGVCTVSGNQVTLTGAGLCTITAHQAGNESYLAAPDVTHSFTVVSQKKIYLPLMMR